MEKTLIRVDKNGTKYYHCVGACGKCNGKGRIEYYAWYDDGICFDCGGSGLISYEEKEYTQEYLDKLEKRRLEKAKKQRPQRDAKFFSDNGISSDGCAWMVLGNTYEIKEDIKASGGKYSEIIGWHFDHEVSGFDTYKLTKEDMFCEDYLGYNWNVCGENTIYDIVNCIRNEYENSHKCESVNSYVANIGDRLDFNLKLISSYCFESSFGISYIYKFNDANNNEIVWKTSTVIGYYNGNNEWQPINDGDMVKVKGTVKEHKEYKGVKQTAITRCKVIA